MHQSKSGALGKTISALALSLAVLAPLPAAADWPMFLKNSTHIPYAEKAPQPPLGLKWKFQTEGPVYSSPVVSKGKVFAGSYDGHLYAIDAKTGGLVWKFKTDGEIYSTPAVEGGVVYFGSRDKNVYAVDANTGKQVWKFETGGPVMTSPVVAEGNVYIGSMDLYLYAISAKDGKREWRMQLPDYEKYSGVYSSPIYSDGILYYAGKNGMIYSASAKSGGRNWSYRTNSAIYGSPVLRDGILYFTAYNRTFFALKAADGSFVWRKNLDNKLAYASPVVTADKIYMALKSGEVKVYNRADGGEAATYKFADEVNSTPALAANGFLYVGCDDGGFYAVDTRTGVIAWKYMTEGSIQSSPAISEEMVFVGSRDGNIYAFGE